jgi:ribonuclease-3
MTQRVQQLEQILDCRFSNRSLLIQAVTHPSYMHEVAQEDGDYQRLEFLGDSILGFLLAELLYKTYPEWDEGALSRLRSRLAGQDVLADRARLLQLGSYIRLGRGEEQTAGRDKDSILSDILEAILAALYLDQGMQAARMFVVRLFTDLAASPHGLTLGKDSKSELQELLSARGVGHPEYRPAGESGPPHDRSFCFDLVVDGELIAHGEGKSKKNAQQAAAAAALATLRPS